MLKTHHFQPQVTQIDAVNQNTESYCKFKSQSIYICVS